MSLKNKISLPMFGLLLSGVVSTIPVYQSSAAVDAEEYPDFYNGAENSDKGIDFVKSISVVTPEYCSFIKGDTTVVFSAPGMTTARVLCWQQPTDENPASGGHDAVISEMSLIDGKEHSFVFHADEFPNGPITIRIQAKNDTNKQDICELQLYNLGGVIWNQGIPEETPPGAEGMKLVFQDDFDGPLSISPDGSDATYAAHKTGGGDFSGWQFSDPVGENLPFGQRGTFLRIHASKPYGTKGMSGILSSIRPDGTGVYAYVPSYFECRFIAHSAPGSWPAFWTLTKGNIGKSESDPTRTENGTDELDIIEAYGGYGPKNPNSGGVYCQVSHFWGQEKPGWAKEKLDDGTPNPDYKPTSFRTDTLKLGNRSSWSWSPHTYGLAITETDTVYYFDNIEVGRHPTGDVSKSQAAWFLINYAIGGISGWQIDMDRYNNKTDMWVDFVRVYSGRVMAPEIKVTGFAGKTPARVSASCGTDGAVIRYTTDGTEPDEESPRYDGPLEITSPSTVKAKAFCEGLVPSPTSARPIEEAPGISGSIAINFVTESSSSQHLRVNDAVGLDDVKQAYWNEFVIGTSGPDFFLDSQGVPTGISVSIEGDAKPQIGEPWGFSLETLKLKRGCVQPNPEIVIKGLDFDNYDVIVYLSAGFNSSAGNVTISTDENSGAVAANPVFYFAHGWLAGKHTVSKTTTNDKPDNSNVIRFEGNKAKSIKISLKSTDWWTGIAGLQIIPR